MVEARKAAVGDGTEVRRLLPQRTLRTGLPSVRLAPSGGAAGRFFVAGGVPFAELLVMWWNFVARTGAEIAQYRADWAAGRFGEVRGYPGEPLAAPPLPAVPLRPR